MTVLHDYRMFVLSNGRFATLISEAGGGYSASRGYALTRWAPDPTMDADGFTIFIRDIDTGEFWTAAGAAADGYTFTAEPGRVSFGSEKFGIRTSLDVTVSAGFDAELRRVALANESDRVRRLDVTTCTELALNTVAADAAHPAFSRLFIQTEYLPAHRALLAWRRLRSPDDRPLYAVHALLGDRAAGPDEVEHETDRAAFIGRGRTRAAPAAMQCAGVLGRTAGSVLDPLFSVRRAVTLQPGASASLTSIDRKSVV